MTEQERQQLNELVEFKKSLESSSMIPLGVDQALRARLTTQLSVSSKAASSENQTIDEAGASVVFALNIADGFLQVTINNSVYYIPYFT